MASRLLVEVAASLGTFREDMGRASAIAEANAKKIEKSFNSAKAALGTALGAIAGVVSVGVFVGWAKETIAAAAALDDLADATGSSVENLSKLANQAKISGTDFGTLQGLVLKLTAGMAGADDESSNVGRALRFLGVEAKDPAEALQQVAVALSKYADGTGKAAIARDLFGKGGPAFLATLKDIANMQDVAATTTTRQAAEAEKLEQAFRRLTVQGTYFKDLLLGPVVEALNNTIDRFKIAREAGLGFLSALNLATNKVLSADVSDLGASYDKQIGARLKEQEEQVEHIRKAVESAKSNVLRHVLPGSMFFSQEQLDKEEAALRALRAVHLKTIALTEPARGGDKKPAGYGSRDDKGGGLKGSKVVVDEFAKALEAAGKKAAVVDLELREAMFGAKELTQAQKDLAVIQADKVWETFTKTQRDQITATYESISAKQLEAVAWKKSREENEKQIKVYEDLAAAQQRQQEKVTASLGAYGDQNKVLEKQLAIVGQEDVVHQRLAATLEYEWQLKEANATTDIKARDETVAALDKEYATRLKLVDAFDKANKALAKQREEEQKSIDFVNALGQSFASATEDVIVFGGKASDVLKALEKDLLRIVTRRLVTQPLEAGLNTFLTGMGVGNVGAGGIGAGANWGAMLAKLAASYFGGSSGAGWTSGYDLPMGYASGGNPPVGRPYLVGERGPELRIDKTPSIIIPNNVLKFAAGNSSSNSTTYVQNFNTTVMPGATKQTASQAAGELGRMMQQAQRNN